MKKLLLAAPVLIALLATLSISSCTIVETGEVGLRVNFDRTVEPTELQAGSFNQTIIGRVMTFPIKDVVVQVADLQPLANDNSTMKDFDLTVVYSITPAAVSDLYVNKNKSFHSNASDGDILLMYAYIQQTARNAVYKVARRYEALTMNDNRAAIEQEIRESINDTFASEKLTGINISQVQVRAIVPSDAVRQSADALVRAKNEEKTKIVEVEIAKKEAERIAALNANKGAIDYMNAQANMKIAEAVAAGKVQTIILPYDFKGIVNAGR
jgi:regulator of protease activity HflC (stomatin/prohibitin superfamily)